jgi:aryl-alcohol dehydrogenase-like predicted oxidoreductase
MTYSHLGRSGIKVSRLCLGTLNFGPETSEDESFAIMDSALECGVNFFDTANVYGWQAGKGVTESILGKWFAQQPGRREQVILASKVYMRTGDGPNDEGLSAGHIIKACEESLVRLQTDHIDLYQMHHVDRSTPWEEIWQAMELLVRQGKVIYIGSSNFAGWHIARCQETALRRNLLGLVSEQSIYNLAERTVELEVIPACREYGIGFLPWSPLDRGLLAGHVSYEDKGEKAAARLKLEVEKYGDRLEPYHAVCREAGETPADIALAWLLHNPDVTAPVIGPRTREEMKRSVRCLDISLKADIMEKLEMIWPGPGGPAPEAYAW